MRKAVLVLFCVLFCVGNATGALREQNMQNNRQSSPRTETKTVVRSDTQKRTVTSRNATNNNQRKQTNSRAATNKVVVGRSAIQKNNATRISVSGARIARAAATQKTRTFGDNYNSCRDAYFTCMDQFCANQNETYRRCVCSSKLKDIQNQEKLLSQTNTNLQSFQDLNIDSISKTANEVKAMNSASDGENAIKKDKSDSANSLKNISDVLSDTKKQSLSNSGKLDIGGDIKAIWTTTNLIGGSDIANLTGEALFNAVHSQCSEMVAETCAASDLKMVSSAYGMYIENDCSVLQKNLDAKTTNANASIRTSRHKMQDARLENYNVHNSLNLNDCIANVRSDILADTACGQDYIHCLDFSGKYLNITSGEVIYSPDFYQIENQLSLTGDVLKNSQNASFITMLNKKRVFAQKNLDLCQDNADDVWNEFLRQALVEIYQGQQKRVASVKSECLQVVNQCYLEKSDSLKQFTDANSPAILAQTLVLSEEMCAEKLNTCSNLYGGGSNGLETLIATMTGITDLSIEQSCPDLLSQFAKSICAPSESDSAHSYPYGCRKYAPGEAIYATNETCNTTLVNPFARSDILATNTTYVAYANYLNYCTVSTRAFNKRYSRCNFGYYLYNSGSNNQHNFIGDNSSLVATECRKCPDTAICPGGTDGPQDINSELYEQCGQYYIGSLYQQLVIYALQNCTRPTDDTKTLSQSLLSDVDKVAKSIRTSLIALLSQDCDNLGGQWVDATWTDDNQDGYHDTNGNMLLTDFYVSTGANKLWGYCKKAAD